MSHSSDEYLRKRRDLLRDVKERLFALGWRIPSSVQDLRLLCWELVEVLSPFLKRAKKKRLYDDKLHFWSTWQAFAVYSSVGLAIVSKRFWCLGLGALVLV